ncbi:uncharacterized protein LOC135206897 [Macrobrachium nipponense]|uniref:uncharacterized protein LOC135206897 n=1 Tax=Macrobrachium nipponense TaxID=159736 RepID=UPI0030C86401
MIMRADKGGATVVMNTSDYLDKAYALLNDTQTYLTLRSPPIATKMQQEFNRKIRKIANTLSDPLHKELVLSKISSRSPSVPYFYGVPKVHKPGYPLRPIIAACGSPQNTLAEWLAQVLSQFLGTFSSAHLQHSFQFIQRVKDSNWVDGRMASLDVTALFTNVPLDYVITKLQEEHDQGIIASLDVESLFTNVPVDETIEHILDRVYRSPFEMAREDTLSLPGSYKRDMSGFSWGTRVPGLQN